MDFYHATDILKDNEGLAGCGWGCSGDPAGDLRLLLFDAYHDAFRGVVCLVEVMDGALRAGDRLTAASTGDTYDASEVCARARLGRAPASCGSLAGPHTRISSW